MISVITYGRNDNYGFNLAKRTAMGFNCLAEILAPDDEIIFVDYNTPGHLPTLPEFIWDTFTEKALKLIRVIRISSALHERLRADSPLPILENVSRNAGIVRSNPNNRWILSTNPDVILVLASRWPTLGELMQSRPAGFYEMPRFDIPEGVWSSLSRTDPSSNMQLLRDWLIMHSAAVVETVPDYRFQKFLLFDAPGDFQLAPREQFFRLRGFDEGMNKYLHSDANLAKRMWLLNGRRTHHLLGDLWVIHQDHYLSGEWAKNVSTIDHNDYHSKVIYQERVEANDDGWGLRDFALPDYALADKVAGQRTCFPASPSSSNGHLPLSQELDWQLQPFYRLCHYQPEVLTLYLRQVLEVMPSQAQVFYLGENGETLEQVNRAWRAVSPGGTSVQHLSDSATPPAEPLSPDVLLIDCFYQRSDYWAKRIQLVQEQLQRQREKGRLTEQEAEEELTRFADNTDAQVLQKELQARWEKWFPVLRMRPGAYVILLGCNPYVNIFATFQEMFARIVTGVQLKMTRLRRLHAFYQRLKHRLQDQTEESLLIKILWGFRLLKRRVMRRLSGHGSLMGWVYFLHVTRTSKQIVGKVNLRRLYVHHRLIVMQVEP